MPSVRLIDATHNAVDKLLYTKSTRLELCEDTEQKIKDMTPEQKQAELDYMANTIPSSWEFVNYTFEIRGVTRAFTHQFVRTRTGSYAQQTMRMLEMEKFGYLVPKKIADHGGALAIYQRSMAQIQDAYDAMLEIGIPAEDARGVLPTNIHTNIIAQFNLRTMSEMAKSRVGLRTQSEYRDVFDMMVEAIFEVHPWAEAFLFPKGKDASAELEAALKGAFEAGALSQEDYIQQLKHVDLLRKA